MNVASSKRLFLFFSFYYCYFEVTLIITLSYFT